MLKYILQLCYKATCKTATHLLISATTVPRFICNLNAVNIEMAWVHDFGDILVTVIYSQARLYWMMELVLSIKAVAFKPNCKTWMHFAFFFLKGSQFYDVFCLKIYVKSKEHYIHFTENFCIISCYSNNFLNISI